MLTPERIAKLAARKNVKAIAVENFLSTLGTMTYGEAMGNLRADQKSYRWTAATFNAIVKGIEENYRP